MTAMYQLCFYVPSSHLEHVKNALFAAGAGRYNGYDRCAWQTSGQGQFRPLANSHPYLGEIGQLEVVVEYKVEMVCVENKIREALTALMTAHPYEQPAYSIYKTLNITDIDTINDRL